MLHALAARVLMMITETGTDIAEQPLILNECIEYVLRKMPASLRTTMAFNIHIEVLATIYDALPIDFGNAPEYGVDPRP